SHRPAERFLETFLKRDCGLPADRGGRETNVRLYVPLLSGARGKIPHLPRRTFLVKRDQEAVGELIDAYPVPAPNMAYATDTSVIKGANPGANHITDMNEIPALFSIAEDRDRLPPEEVA